MKKPYLLILILALGFFLRLSGINFGLPSKNLALTTYNPDEPLTIYSLEAMNPSKLDFSPKRAFLWGGFSVYIVGFFLKLAQFLKIVNPVSRDFLMANLGEVDKLYIIGRLISIFFGTANILILYLIVKKAYNRKAGLISAGLLSVAAAHVISSFYVRPDVIMLFFALSGILVSVNILSGAARAKNYALAGLLIGIGTATKLSAGIFGIVPVIAHFLSGEGKLKDKKLLILIASGFAGFLLACPYSVLDFPTWWYYFKMNFAFAQGTTHPVELALHGPGRISYLTYYLPSAMGILLVISGVAGFIFMLARTLKQKPFSLKSSDGFFLLSGTIIYMVISGTKNQATWYTLPVIPFFLIFTGRLTESLISFSKGRLSKLLAWAFLVIIFCQAGIYSMAHLRLYTSVNTREMASQWIDTNIPKNKTIAIARSYFWTPGILRQYKPPYKLLMGGDIQSALSDAVLGLDKIAPRADYIVLTEFEYRDYIVPGISAKLFPGQEKTIAGIMLNDKKYEKIASFNKEAEFLGFNFRKNFLPHDWLIPNPEILIFKKKALNS